ncbi:DMT family transporter [Halorubrum rubrum]|uniref:DMT family transporter n=1 Tax=Halorubrum rubrum TaxID=1126240 RepID=A0ABD5R221_9EURY|nr:DMT family transporter [Halorubrum rubrum]
MFLLVTLLFGTAFPAVKTGLSFIPPLLFAATRSYLAAALLLVYVGATTEYWYPRSRPDVTAVLAGGLFLVGGTGIGFVAQQFITAGVAAIIFSLAPIITAVLAWPLLPAERLAGRDYVGVFLGFVGIAVVIRPIRRAFSTRNSSGNCSSSSVWSLLNLGPYWSDEAGLPCQSQRSPVGRWWSG